MSKSMAVDTKEVKTTAQRRQELKAKLEQLDAQVEKDAMEGIKEQLANLADIGKPHILLSKTEYDALNARQTPKSAPPRATKATPKAKEPAQGPSANFDGQKMCPICEFTGHDGRAHRSQNPKAKFTPAELTQRGLQAPEAAIA